MCLQMNNEIRKAYLRSFEDMFDFFKSQGVPNIFNTVKPIVENKIKMEYGTIDKSDLESLALEVYEQYGGGIVIPKVTAIRGENSHNWFGETNPTYRYYWPRYNRYLKEVKKWERETRKAICFFCFFSIFLKYEECACIFSCVTLFFIF